MINYAMSMNFKKYVRVTHLIDKMLCRLNTINIGPPTSRSNPHLRKIQVKQPKSNEK